MTISILCFLKESTRVAQREIFPQDQRYLILSVRTINVLNLQLSIILQVSVISASKVMF